MMAQDYDVIIMGGGLVGASLAACLGRNAGIRVAVVDKVAPPQQAEDVHPSYDARNTALTNGTCHVFQQLGLWQALRQNASPIESILISDQGGFGHAEIHAREERVRALGYVVENRYIGAALFGYLESLPNVHYLAPATITGLQSRAEGIQVNIEQPGSIHQQQLTPLLVIADGAQSQGRKLLGIGARVSTYDQVALVTAVTPAAGHHQRAWERFTADGPLALLPQTEGRFGVTWCLSPQRAEHLLAVSPERFLAELEQAAGPDLGRLVRVGQRVQYPLVLSQALEQVRPNLVVLGNAAHSLHPVAGQGFNLAMRDVVVLVRELMAASGEGQSWGDLSVLQGYLQRRVNDQLKTLYFSHGLTTLFSNQHRLLSPLRNLGLGLFDTLTDTKRLVARHAMGRAVSTTLPEPL